MKVYTCETIKGNSRGQVVNAVIFAASKEDAISKLTEAVRYKGFKEPYRGFKVQEVTLGVNFLDSLTINFY